MPNYHRLHRTTLISDTAGNVEERGLCDLCGAMSTKAINRGLKRYGILALCPTCHTKATTVGLFDHRDGSPLNPKNATMVSISTYPVNETHSLGERKVLYVPVNMDRDYLYSTHWCIACGRYERPGETFETGEFSRVSPNSYICPECAAQLERCPECGRPLSAVHGMIVWHNGHRVRVCRSHNAFNCIHCGERHLYSDNDPDHNDICPTCLPLYTRCNECGRMVPNNDLSEGVCSNCRTVRYGIRGYHQGPPLQFHPEPADNEHPLYLGIELEVDNPSCSIGQARRQAVVEKVIRAVGLDHMYVTRDGSLTNGFEQITMPATLDYMLSNRERYEQLCTIPKAAGFTSHDAGTCGLHVHVSRDFIGSPENVAKLVYLSERFWTQFFLFSRRSPERGYRYATRYFKNARDRAEPDKIPLEKVNDLIRRTSERYRSVNTTTRQTVEFRLFRGTLHVPTFWATLQWVDNFVRLATATPSDDIPRISWSDIIHYREYPELTAYNDRRVPSIITGLPRTVPNITVTDDAGTTSSEEVTIADQGNTDQLATDLISIAAALDAAIHRYEVMSSNAHDAEELVAFGPISIGGRKFSVSTVGAVLSWLEDNEQTTVLEGRIYANGAIRPAILVSDTEQPMFTVYYRDNDNVLCSMRYYSSNNYVGLPFWLVDNTLSIGLRNAWSGRPIHNAATRRNFTDIIDSSNNCTNNVIWRHPGII